ncbi:hypothetical protein GCM10023224_05580 [Streptomonospora halophila]|uniref:Holliday junction resolvase RusA (Prophage-encoded endonuclease) n=1 Tax=Streptomonospora halophila TaxID=427369 RepID=A0ABP9G8Q6_9ACTN
MTATNPIPLVLAGWDLSITANGTPAGQGRVSFLGKGRPAIHSNQKTLKPWRAAIMAAAERAMLHHRHATLAGVPVQTDITITVPKPSSAPKRRRTWPVTRFSSDLDHHVRAIHDSLSEAKVFADDSQVVEMSARKVYPGEHEFALSEPGAVVHVRVLPEAVAR